MWRLNFADTMDKYEKSRSQTVDTVDTVHVLVQWDGGLYTSTHGKRMLEEEQQAVKDS